MTPIRSGHVWFALIFRFLLQPNRWFRFRWFVSFSPWSYSRIQQQCLTHCSVSRSTDAGAGTGFGTVRSQQIRNIWRFAVNSYWTYGEIAFTANEFPHTFAILTKLYFNITFKMIQLPLTCCAMLCAGESDDCSKDHTTQYTMNLLYHFGKNEKKEIKCET